MTIIKIPDVSKGVNIDTMPEELADGVWSWCKNMRFKDGFAQRFRGLSEVLTTPTIVPYFITPYQTNTKKYWIYASQEQVFADDGTTATEITPASVFTGAQTDRWTAGTLSGLFVMNNGVDEPVYWDGDTANNLAPLPGWTSGDLCASIIPFKEYLVALDITKGSDRYPHMVKWSHSSEPGSLPSSWDETDLTKDAGEIDLAQTPDLLVDAIPMGDVLIVYKERSMYAMSFIGQPYIWRFNRLPGDTGMLYRGCGVATPVGHVVLTAGDVIIHQAQGVQSIANTSVRNYIFNNIESSNYSRAFVTMNPQSNEVLICFPESGQDYCSKAAVWNWVDKTWGLRDLPSITYGDVGQANISNSPVSWDGDPDTWDDDSSEWNQNEYAPNESRLLLVSADQKIISFDVGVNDFTTPVEGILERTQMTFGDSQSVKFLRTIYPKIDAGAGTVITFQAGSTMSPDVSPSWGTPVSFTVGTDNKVDIMTKGRYLSLRISTEGSSPWRLRSLDMDIQGAGRH